MIRRLGIDIGAREVRMILVKSKVVSWHATARFDGTNELAQRITELLAQMPRSFRRVNANAVVSPAWVQTKQLHGLPPVKSAKMVNQLVNENQRAFFLWKGEANLIPDIHWSRGGEPWGAAFDKRVVDELMRALRSQRFRVSCVAPAIVSIVAAMPDTRITWCDGDDCFALEGDRGGLRRADRITPAAPAEPVALPESLAALGDDAPEYLAAYSAAVAQRNVSLAWRPHSSEDRRRTLDRVGRVAILGVLCGVVLFAAAGPGIRADRIARSANRVLARVRVEQADLVRSQRELQQVTKILNRIESFRGERGRVTRLLGELSQTMPESTAMLTFHVDSTEGGFTVISPHVADILPELASVTPVIEPRIIGSVTREVFSGVRIERGAFRFRRMHTAHGQRVIDGKRQ